MHAMIATPLRHAALAWALALAAPAWAQDAAGAPPAAHSGPPPGFVAPAEPRAD